MDSASPKTRGKTSEKQNPIHLFNTWLDFRLSKGQSRADIIREINLKVGRKYDNNRCYTWIKSQQTVPDLIVVNVINPEMADLYSYYFEKNNFAVVGVNFKMLAEAFKASIKDKDVKIED